MPRASMTASAVGGSRRWGRPGRSRCRGRKPAIRDLAAGRVHRDEQIGVFQKQRGHRCLPSDLNLRFCWRNHRVANAANADVLVDFKPVPAR